MIIYVAVSLCVCGLMCLEFTFAGRHLFLQRLIEMCSIGFRERVEVFGMNGIDKRLVSGVILRNVFSTCR